MIPTPVYFTGVIWVCSVYFYGVSTDSAPDTNACKQSSNDTQGELFIHQVVFSHNDNIIIII